MPRSPCFPVMTKATVGRELCEGFCGRCQDLTFGHAKSPDHQTALLIPPSLLHHRASPGEITPPKCIIFSIFSHFVCFFFFKRKCGRRVIHGRVSPAFRRPHLLIPLSFHLHLSAPSLCKSTQSCLLGQLSSTVPQLL